MMNYLLIALFLFSPLFLPAQQKIEWSPEYKLESSDFKSPVTQVGRNAISMVAANRIEFSYQMSQYEFMFTKNFNSKVVATFTPSASYYVASDKESIRSLINFARMSFDLTELYARKLRQKIFEEKGAFSNANFFVPLYEDIQKQLSERHALLIQSTDLGRNETELKKEHALVLQEIEALPDFCKTCKPKKKKGKTN